MCGIIGFNWKNKKLIERKTNNLKHRGPDNQSIFISKNISIGHSRLAIIDLDKRSNQPLINENKKLIITFNGEIYNFKEIKTELEKKGHKFKTTSDTEVLLKGFEEWSEKLVDKLDGMFAFCIVNTDKKELFLARDHFGLKPLYYFSKKDKFAFSSELRELIEFTDKKISKEGLEEYFNYRFTKGKNTLIKNIHKVLPGEFLKVKYETGKITKTKYYSLKLKQNKLNKKETKKKIKELVTKAIKKRLIADVQIGSFLSGGLDSTIVTTIAKKINPKLNTFSMGFETTNELEYAKIVSKKIKSKHKEFNYTQKKLFNQIETIIKHMDEPIGDAGFVPIYALSKEASKYNKVVLCGDGSDEIFCGYDRYKLYHYSKLINWIPFNMGKDILIKIQKTKNKKGFKKFFEITRLLDKNELKKIKIKDKAIKFENENKNLNEIMKYDIETLLPNDFFMKTDKMAGSSGLEIRTPFMDKELVEFVMSIKPQWKLRFWNEKKILKETFKKIIPKEITKRRKQGFNVPIDYWFKNKLNKELKTLLNRNNHQLYSKEEIYKLLDKIKTINENKYKENFIIAQKLWAVYVFEKWYEMYIK